MTLEEALVALDAQTRTTEQAERAATVLVDEIHGAIDVIKMAGIDVDGTLSAFTAAGHAMAAYGDAIAKACAREAERDALRIEYDKLADAYKLAAANAPDIYDIAVREQEKRRMLEQVLAAVTSERDETQRRLNAIITNVGADGADDETAAKMLLLIRQRDAQRDGLRRLAATYGDLVAEAASKQQVIDDLRRSVEAWKRLADGRA